MWIGGVSEKPDEAETMNMFNLLTATGVTSNGQLSFNDVDGNTITQIPAGWKITEVIIKETETEDAGDISLGTTALGTDIVNAMQTMILNVQ